MNVKSILLALLLALSFAAAPAAADELGTGSTIVTKSGQVKDADDGFWSLLLAWLIAE